MNSNVTLQKLQSISWIMMLISMLIDTTHSRSFPSYNFFIGAFCSYTAHQFFEKKSEDAKASITRVFSALFVLITVSLILDVIYCAVWGNEILDGSAQIKFSFIFMIVNMFVKVVAICYVSFAIVDQYENSTKPVGSMLNDSVDMENENAVECTTSHDAMSDAIDTIPHRDLSPPGHTGHLSPVVRFPTESLFLPKKAFFGTPSP